MGGKEVDKPVNHFSTHLLLMFVVVILSFFVRQKLNFINGTNVAIMLLKIIGGACHHNKIV